MKNWKERKDIVLLKLKSRQYYQLWYLIKNRLKINLIMKPIGVPIAILIVPIIYAIRPFLRINFLSIPTGRLGHLLLQPEIYIREKKISTPSQRCLDIFFTLNFIFLSSFVLHVMFVHLFFFSPILIFLFKN